MQKSDIDKIIHTQLIIARMGEKELMNWWNVDIAFELGGADFLKRLLGDTMAPLAAGEGVLRAAHLKESQLIDEMPDNQNVYSLFRPDIVRHGSCFAFQAYSARISMTFLFIFSTRRF